MLPETTLQFGAGNFLRAFADLFIHEANESGQAAGRVVVVQSTDSNRAAALNDAGGKYHVLIRGRDAGTIVDRVLPVATISRALDARTQWTQVLDLAASPELRYVISNVTEAGYALYDADAADGVPPRSLPAKLAQVLRTRALAGMPGVTVLPCELIESNGQKLRDLVLEQMQRWGGEASVEHFIRESCCWTDTLVDRIVSGRPTAHPLLAEDPLLTVAEPFAMWAIEPLGGSRPLFQHPAMRIVADVRPYSLRKIRILNGAHTALVAKAIPMGIQTVRQAVQNPAIHDWLCEVLFEEIVPVLEGRVEGARLFAEQTLERFTNPFLEHKLADIALNHAVKLQTRLAPTIAEYTAMTGTPPPLLSRIMA